MVQQENENNCINYKEQRSAGRKCLKETTFRTQKKLYKSKTLLLLNIR